MSPMSQKQTSRNRVHDRQLWDADGQRWKLQDRYDADADEVAGLVRSGAPVAVHGFGRPMRWVTGHDVAATLDYARKHEFDADEDGLTYTPCIWVADGRRLLTFETDC